jgi:hypothetical protein
MRVETLRTKLRPEARLRLKNGGHAADVGEDRPVFQLLQLRLKLLRVLAADHDPRAVAIIRRFDGGHEW